MCGGSGVCVWGGGGLLHGVKFMVWPVLSTAQQDIDTASTPFQLHGSNHGRAAISRIYIRGCL